MVMTVTTHYDEQLAPLLDEPAVAAQIVSPHYVGSALWKLKRMTSSSTSERGLKHTNLLALTADRVVIFPVRLARKSGITLETAILDWPSAEVAASGVRRCHLGSPTGGGGGKYDGDYVLLELARDGDQLSVELPREGSQTMLRALSASLTGKW
jgi:hypothetical protein